MRLAYIVSYAAFAPLQAVYVFMALIWNYTQHLIASIVIWISGSDQRNVVPVYSIIYRRKLTEIDISHKNDFMWLFRGLEKLGSILVKKEVQPYSIDEQCVLLVETDPGIDIHSSHTSPLLYVGQFKCATKLYVFTHEQFHRQALALRQPEVKVLLLSSTGRCGSTLITQMFESTKSLYCLSEPESLTNIKEMQFHMKLSSDQIKLLLESVFTLFTHSASLFGARIAFVKTRSCCLPLVPLIHRQVPWVLHLFMYRQGIATIRSQVRAFTSNALAQYLTRNAAATRQLAINLSLDVTGSYDEIDDFFTLCALMWIRSLSDVRQFNRQLKIPIPSLRYEGLIDQPYQYIKAINHEYDLALNESEVSSALEAIKMDSQRGLIISKEAGQNMTSNHGGHDAYTSRVRVKLDALCAEFDVPNLESHDRVESSPIVMGKLSKDTETFNFSAATGYRTSQRSSFRYIGAFIHRCS